jgi:general secretion pathway protein I
MAHEPTAAPPHAAQPDAGSPRSSDVFGFTLLEVMVAVAILGLALTVVLSSQVGLFKSGTYGQHVSEAIGLGRCKMSELEEQFLKFGYPFIDTADEGPCCAGDDSRRDMTCSWKIETIELPQPVAMNFGASDGGVNPAGSTGAVGFASPTSTSTGLGAIGALAGATMDPNLGSGAYGSPTSTLPFDPSMGGGLGAPNGLPPGMPAPTGTLDPTAIIGSLSSTSGGGLGALAGGGTAGAAGGVGALAPMVMSIVYPSLKPMLEASIRKVTLKVSWREGIAQREVEMIQWVTSPQTGGFLGDVLGSGSAYPGGMFPPGLGGLPGAGAGTSTGLPGISR